MHALSVVIDSEAPLVLFEIMLKAVEHAGEILGLLPVAEGDELEQNVKGQRRERQRRATFDFCWEGIRHNLAEASHVEHKAFFQLETPVRGDRLAKRKEVQEAPRSMLHSMR